MAIANRGNGGFAQRRCIGARIRLCWGCAIAADFACTGHQQAYEDNPKPTSMARHVDHLRNSFAVTVPLWQALQLPSAAELSGPIIGLLSGHNVALVLIGKVTASEL